MCGGAPSLFLGPVLSRLACDSDPTSSDGGLKDNLGKQILVSEVTTQITELVTTSTGNLAVEGKGNSVENGRLSGSGRAIEQEDAGGSERVEVDSFGAGEWPEGGEL